MPPQLVQAAVPTRVVERPRVMPGRSGVSALTLAAISAVAFILRVHWIVKQHTYHIPVFPDDHFYFGYETGRIARSIATGHGFSSPFLSSTGPTAWLAPVYPYLTADVFKVFGVYTDKSAFVLLLLNALFSALTCIPIYLIGRKLFSPRVALWSAWAWALVSSLSYWAIHWVWETSLSTLLLTLIVLLTLELAETGGLRRWLLFGALWGFAALTNPALLSLLPFFGLWACRELHKKSRAWFWPATASAVMFFALIAPWLVRNYNVMHRLVFIRDNFGAELRLGNGPGASGLWMEWLHPTQNPIEMEKYRRLGEVRYIAQREAEAFAYIRQHPFYFTDLCFRRAIYFWAGYPRPVNGAAIVPQLELRNSEYLALSVLAFWGFAVAIDRRKRGVFVLGSMLLVYPIVYYLVFPHPRYRHPIEPVMVILAAYLVSQTSNFRRRAPVVPFEMQHASRITAVLPLKDDLGRVAQITKQLMSSGLDIEVVVVGRSNRVVSPDAAEALDSCVHKSAARVVWCEAGSTEAESMRRAVSVSTGDLVAFIEPNACIPFDDLAKVVDPVLRGRADVAYSVESHRVVRSFWSADQALNTLFRLVTGTNIGELHPAYRVFRRKDLLRIRLSSRRFSIAPELTWRAIQLGLNIVEVPVTAQTQHSAQEWPTPAFAALALLKMRFLT